MFENYSSFFKYKYSTYRSSFLNNDVLQNNNLILRYGDMTDSSNLLHIMSEIRTKYITNSDDSNTTNFERLEIYNLAAMSHVKVSFEMPEYTANADGTGVLRLLEAIRSSGIPQEKSDFIKRPHQNYTAKFRKFRKPNPPHSTPVLHASF